MDHPRVKHFRTHTLIIYFVFTFIVWLKYPLGPRNTPARDASAHPNLDNFCALRNAPSDQTRSTFNQPVPKRRANSGPPHPNKANYMALAKQLFSIFLFPLLYSLSSESFLPSFPILQTVHLYKY